MRVPTRKAKPGTRLINVPASGCLARCGRPEDCLIRAELPESDRARFDHLVDFFGRLLPVLEEFRRDYPEIDGEVRALLAEGHEPESALNLVLLTKHPREGRFCDACRDSGRGIVEDVLCFYCQGAVVRLARYGPPTRRRPRRPSRSSRARTATAPKSEVIARG